MDEISQAQAALSRTAAITRVGEDPELRRHVREEGEHFIRLFNGLLRMTRVHDLENRAFEQPSRDLSAMIGRLMDRLGPVHLVAVEDQVYINDIRIPMDRRWEGRTLDSELRRHNVGGVTFTAVPSDHDIRQLVGCFASAPDEEAPRTALMGQIVQRGINGVQLTGIYRFRTSDEAVRTRAAAEPAAERVMGVVEELWSAIAENRLVNPLPARRLVSEVLANPEGLTAEGLLAEAPAATPNGAHAWRVCLISLLLGRVAGLDDAALQDLGLCALFHDAGYAYREGAEAASDDGPGHPGYPPPFERHTTAGARMLLHQRGFSEAKVRRALAALEHHRDFGIADGAVVRERPFLFARVIRIAEDYDNFTHRASVPGHDRPGMSPAEALARMCRAAGRAYDPILLQLLVNVLGRFPPGTLLRLTDGRVVQSVSLVRSPETFDRPLTRVMKTASGAEPGEPMFVDLAQEAQVAGVIR